MRKVESMVRAFKISAETLIKVLQLLIGYFGLMMVIYGWDAFYKMEDFVHEICEVEHSNGKRTVCDRKSFVGLKSVEPNEETFCCFRYTIETVVYTKPLFGQYQLVFGLIVFVLILMSMVTWIYAKSKLRSILTFITSSVIMTMSIYREAWIAEYKIKLSGIHEKLDSFDTPTLANELIEAVKHSIVFSRIELVLAALLLVVTFADYMRQKTPVLNNNSENQDLLDIVDDTKTHVEYLSTCCMFYVSVCCFTMHNTWNNQKLEDSKLHVNRLKRASSNQPSLQKKSNVPVLMDGEHSV